MSFKKLMAILVSIIVLLLIYVRVEFKNNQNYMSENYSGLIKRCKSYEDIDSDLIVDSFLGKKIDYDFDGMSECDSSEVECGQKFLMMFHFLSNNYSSIYDLENSDKALKEKSYEALEMAKISYGEDFSIFVSEVMFDINSFDFKNIGYDYVVKKMDDYLDSKEEIYTVYNCDVIGEQFLRLYVTASTRSVDIVKAAAASLIIEEMYK